MLQAIIEANHLGLQKREQLLKAQKQDVLGRYSMDEFPQRERLIDIPVPKGYTRIQRAAYWIGTKGYKMLPNKTYASNFPTGF